MGGRAGWQAGGRKGTSKAKAREDTPWDHTELTTSLRWLNLLHQPAQVSLNSQRASSKAALACWPSLLQAF